MKIKCKYGRLATNRIFKQRTSQDGGVWKTNEKVMCTKYEAQDYICDNDNCESCIYYEPAGVDK